ncbi:hypothetical protein [Hymenobacter seoulensis]
MKSFNRLPLAFFLPFRRRYAIGCDSHPSRPEHPLIAQERPAYRASITGW